MRALLIAALIATVSSVLLLLCSSNAHALRMLTPRWHQLTPEYSYSQYLLDQGKPAPTTDAEYKMREALFQQELRDVLVHNNEKKKSLYKKGINHMSDWTAAEKKRLNGGRPLEMDSVRRELKSKPWAKTHQVSGKETPASLDWRMRYPNIITAVKNQGMCGDCWAHGAVEGIESHVAIATGNLFVLSQQQLTSCAPNPNDCGGTGGCMGSIAELAFEYVVKAGGIDEEWTYPFTSGTGETGACKTKLPKFAAKISGYVDVKPNDQTAVMDALAFQGPLTVNADASAWSNYESGIYNSCSYDKNISIDHVIQMVGYGYDDDLGASYWTIRNSWSPSYGEHGYIRLLKHDTPQCGTNVHAQDGTACKNQPTTQHVCGMCGILFSCSYPYLDKN